MGRWLILCYSLQVNFPKVTAEKENGSWLFIHTCTGQIDVLLTKELIQLLLQEPDSTAQATRFDAMLHQSLLLAPKDYNRL